MDNRRDFLKKAAVISGGAALSNVLPPLIDKALAISPDPGTTFYDAEHIVFVMQENRSFDHALGSLQGVRGFNDPRAVELANGNKVWLQTNKAGDTYAPFRVNVKDSRIAWMGSIPHGWADQTDARNDGKYDRWLDVKRSPNKAYADMPLVLSYCTREDFPFYYALADAFTVCDQHFCSSITGTHANRLYWMTGTIRDKQTPEGIAHVWNVPSVGTPGLGWKTYPERLEEQGISWRLYQNELSMGAPLQGEHASWLGNFGTNVLEFFKQYNPRLHQSSISALPRKKENILREIDRLEKEADSDQRNTRLAAARKVLATIEADMIRYNVDNFNSLSDFEKRIMNNAFVINSNDPDYHDLAPLRYNDKGTERELNIPKGDVLHQFRTDVQNGKLPTVSWLHSPGNLSDHPGTPWFGSLYVSEILRILTDNPEVWKKTILVLTYDENDGYFDHVPPFVVPNPYKPDTGKLSEGLDAKMEFVTTATQTNPSASPDRLREGPIGLGYRVPMVIASPWSRGGYVCSEVFDHTSSIQFLENFIQKKFGKNIREENVSAWRRAVCGDLTSVFRPYKGESLPKPLLLEKKAFIESVHQARFRDVPGGFAKLDAGAISGINRDHMSSPHFPKQEKGIRPACALPYELYCNGMYDRVKDEFSIDFAAANTIFGSFASGAPFYVYALTPYKGEKLRNWQYGVKAGDRISDSWKVADFENGIYHLRAYGPNGFYREYKGRRNNADLRVTIAQEVSGRSRKKAFLLVKLTNSSERSVQAGVSDNSYKNGRKTLILKPGAEETVRIDLTRSFNWYDLSVTVAADPVFEHRFAGRIETGQETRTDPLMGGVV